MATQNESYKIVLTIDGKDNTSQALNSVNKQLGEMQSGVNSTTQSWNKFKDGVGMAMGAFAIAGGVAAAVGQVNELGRAANAAEVTFTQVSGSADQASESLARMRALTGGVIDDMSLMKGASSLLVTGIAQTNEQAEQLVNLGARLGTVMGVDAAESIANLNAALLNNSFMRLDTLGISAARVRERVNELKEAGMDMSAAFSQAVVEIGGQTLEDLGAAAGVAETAMARLATRATNLGQSIAQGLNTQLETAATTLEQLMILGELALGQTGGIPVLEAQKAQYEAIIPLARQYEQLYTSMALASGQDVNQSLMIEDAARFLSGNQDLAPMFATLGENAGQYFATAFNGQNAEMAAQAREILETAFNVDFSAWTDEHMLSFAAEADVTFRAAADAQESLRIESERTSAAIEEFNYQMAQAANADAFLYASTQTANNLTDIQDQAEALENILSGGSFASAGGFTFFDPTQLGQVRIQAEAIGDEYERLKAIGESTDFELVSEAEVARAREIAESANDTAEQAERNARAWETASLAMIAGATGGGRLNEFNQMVLGQIEDPELRAQAEGQFNLASGVETANTRVLEYGASLVTAITETFGVAAGTRAGQDFVNSFEEGVQMGLEGEALQDYVESAVGYALGEGGGQEIQVQAGEGYIALAQRTGVAREDIEAATGGRMLHAGEIIQVGDGSSLIAVNGDPQQAVYALNAAESQVMNQFTQAPMTEPAYAGLAPYQAGQYTYYDPASMGYTQSTQSAAIMPPEQGETLTMAADSMLIIQDSALVLSETDLSPVFDPMTGDIQIANSEIIELENGLERVGNMEMRIQLPLEFVFDTVTAEIMSRNTQVVELFKLVLPQIGITLP